MSNVPQGPGWWQAADLNWYPPELHPGFTSSQPAGFRQEEPSQPSLEPPAREPYENGTFIAALFDFSFSSLVTLRVIRVLYVLITILLSLAAIIGILAALVRHTPADIVLAVVIIPITYLIYLTFTRIGMEILIVLFNLGKDVRIIRDGRPRTV
jgi:hypothetical protein